MNDSQENLKHALQVVINKAMHVAVESDFNLDTLIAKAEVDFAEEMDTLGLIISDKRFVGNEYALGYWDGEDIYELINVLNGIKKNHPNPVVDYDNLPYNFRLPYRVIEYPTWTMDAQGNCLVGESANDVMTLHDVQDEIESIFSSQTSPGM